MTIINGTHTRIMVRANRQSVAGMVNSVMPKTDCYEAYFSNMPFNVRGKRLTYCDKRKR